MVVSYYLIIWLVTAMAGGVPQTNLQSTKSIVAGMYTTRAECEGAFTAAYGEGLADPNVKALHMCLKAQTVMP